jgi:hypothetical protein
MSASRCDLRADRDTVLQQKEKFGACRTAQVVANVQHQRGKSFPQAGNVHPTLTEEIHNDRIAAS